MDYNNTKIPPVLSCIESTLMQHGVWTDNPAFFHRLMAALGGACRRIRAARFTVAGNHGNPISSCGALTVLQFKFVERRVYY